MSRTNPFDVSDTTRNEVAAYSRAAEEEAAQALTVRRSDITLNEEIFASTYGGRDTREWWAKLDGALSTGERVRLVRQGPTSIEALGALESAISQQGWVIEDKTPDDTNGRER